MERETFQRLARRALSELGNGGGAQPLYRWMAELERLVIEAKENPGPPVPADIGEKWTQEISKMLADCPVLGPCSADRSEEPCLGCMQLARLAGAMGVAIDFGAHEAPAATPHRTRTEELEGELAALRETLAEERKQREHAQNCARCYVEEIERLQRTAQEPR